MKVGPNDDPKLVVLHDGKWVDTNLGANYTLNCAFNTRFTCTRDGKEQRKKTNYHELDPCYGRVVAILSDRRPDKSALTVTAFRCLADRCTGSWPVPGQAYRLVGLVVKASASRAADLDSIPAFGVDLFF